MLAVSEDTWRPLGLDTEDDIATYDALHDGVPNWLRSPFWAWVRDAVTQYRSYGDGSGRVVMLETRPCRADVPDAPDPASRPAFPYCLL